ncbi:myb-like protein X [Mytilus edulis]|uniref:myb-like protein X n=1 Tax=Mytilus edulis TaxID=6550 RepID=UPI0039F08DE8
MLKLNKDTSLREKGNRESVVCGDQDQALQRYVENPKADNKLRSQESDEQGEPKYDYEVTGEISRCTCNESQNRQEESSSHKKENTSKNKTETTKKAGESAVIEDTKEEKANANKPGKRTCLKSGIVHYENEAVNTSVEKANDDIENESVTDKSYVRMRNTDTGSASGQSENECANTSSNKMTAVDIDIEANNDDCMSTPERGINEKMSLKELNTDRENGSEQGNENLPFKSNYMENKDNVHDERFENRDSYSTRESQGSDLSNESRKSDESE